MRTYLSAIAIIVLSASAARAQEGDTESSPVREISPLELSALIKASSVQIMDCNEEENFIWAHVPGAKLVAYDQITSAVLPGDKSATVVFYCYSPECPAAGMAAQSAKQLGHTHVLLMTAGIVGWQDAGLPTEP